MTRRERVRQTASEVALHWITYFGYVHRTPPRPIRTARDRAALRHIVSIQCHGDALRALALIEEIVRAPVAGNTLSARYVAYWSRLDRLNGGFHTAPRIRALIRSVA